MERYELILNSNPLALARVMALVTGRRWQLGSLDFPPATTADRRKLIIDLVAPPDSDQVEAQLNRLYDVLAVVHVHS